MAFKSTFSSYRLSNILAYQEQGESLSLFLFHSILFKVSASPMLLCRIHQPSAIHYRLGLVTQAHSITREPHRALNPLSFFFSHNVQQTV